MHNEIRSQEKAGKEKVKGKGINLEGYGMAFCPNCSGSGRYFYGSRGGNVCQVCKGFGPVRMERNFTFDASGITAFVW